MLRKCLAALCCTLVLCPYVVGFSKRIRLGGLFEEDDPVQRAFVASVNAVNKLRHTTTELTNVFLVPEIQVATDDAFETSQSVCALLKKGVVAIFGPSEKISAKHVQSMCVSVDMPNLVVHWEAEPVRMAALNLYPHANALSLVFLQLVTEFGWKSFTILYDSTDALVRTNQVLKRWNPKGYPVTVRHLGEGPDFREILLTVKQSEEENLVIDVSSEILEDVLKQCQQVGLLSDRHKIIVTNLDFQTIDLEPYQYAGVNFTGVRLVSADDPEAQSTFGDYLFQMDLEDLTQLPVEAALMYDAVQLFARAFKRFEDIVDGDIKQLECDGSDTWEFGASLGNYIRTTEMRGLTGLVKFEPDGFRSDFELDILSLNLAGLKKVGTYNTSDGIRWSPDDSSSSIVDEDDISNTTFRVLIAQSPPYNMLKESSGMLTGNDRYEGFAIEIIQELSKLLHFNYTFIETNPDYGSKGKDGTWSGMLGMIIRERIKPISKRPRVPPRLINPALLKIVRYAGQKLYVAYASMNPAVTNHPVRWYELDNKGDHFQEADLAITDLTITSERESAVDFSMPFMNLGISILYKKPTKAAPSLFSFLAPFSIQVWLYLIGSFILVSLLLFVVGRMCPAEWDNPYPCIEEPEQLENQFTLKNSLWFTIGAIMQQGSEIAPIGMSTRMLGASWWFFCLIIVSSYTANLAAFLVVETIVRPIKSVDDLANLNGEIKYGAKKDGSTYNFFKGSDHTTYMKMFKYMDAHAKEVLTESNDEGKNRVLDDNQNYAFLMESSSIQYIEQRECNVTQIGGLLDAKGYGIAMRKNYKYRNKINTAVLQLQETGLISQIQKKWWEEKRGGGRCKEEGGSSAAAELTLEHVGGVFLVLGIGIALSVPFTFWEFLWEIGSIARKENTSFKTEFMQEMKFVMKCKGNVKEARKPKASSHDTEPSTRASTPPYGFVPTVITTAADNE